MESTRVVSSRVCRMVTKHGIGRNDWLFEQFGIPVQKLSPLTLVTLEVNLSLVIDLTDPHALKELGTTQREVTKLDWQSANDRGEEA